MNLGERIYKLRTQKNLSQGDLADALEVSRQSVSKWETNASVPELDKLVKLSEMFGVTLDELILDNQRSEASAEPEPKVIYVERPVPKSTQKTVGIILLCFAALVWLMVTLFGDIVAGLVLASPFIACGSICLFVHKNVGLWCTWAVYGFFDFYLRLASGVNWQFAFWAIAYASEWTVQLIVAWVLLLSFVTLTMVTVLRFRVAMPTALGKNTIAAAVSWAAYILIWVVFMISTGEPVTDVTQIAFDRFTTSVFGWIRSMMLVAALLFTVRVILLLRNRKKGK